MDSALRCTMIVASEVTDMSQQNQSNSLIAFSNAMADAVEKAAASTLLVDARRRIPASGVVFAADLEI